MTAPLRTTDRSGELPDPQSIPAILARLGRETSQLITQETALMRNELEAKFVEARRSAMALSAGAGALGAGFIVLLFAAASGLSYLWPQWLAFLVVGAAVTVVGAVVAAVSRKGLEPRALAPKETVAMLRKDGDFLKEQVIG